MIMEEFKNTKTFFLKDTLQIGEKKFLLLAKLKSSTMNLNGGKIVGTFYEKELQKN